MKSGFRRARVKNNVIEICIFSPFNKLLLSSLFLCLVTSKEHLISINTAYFIYTLRPITMTGDPKKEQVQL